MPEANEDPRVEPGTPPVHEGRSRALVGLLLGGAAFLGCSLVRTESPTPGAAVSARDFFLYACVREYSKIHSLPLFDGSVGYAVERSDASAESLEATYAAAQAFARTLRAPDLSDPEHGGVAVLALCLEESAAHTAPARARTK